MTNEGSAQLTRMRHGDFQPGLIPVTESEEVCAADRRRRSHPIDMHVVKRVLVMLKPIALQKSRDALLSILSAHIVTRHTRGLAGLADVMTRNYGYLCQKKWRPTQKWLSTQIGVSVPVLRSWYRTLVAHGVLESGLPKHSAGHFGRTWGYTSATWDRLALEYLAHSVGEDGSDQHLKKMVRIMARLQMSRDEMLAVVQVWRRNYGAYMLPGAEQLVVDDWLARIGPDLCVQHPEI